MKLRRLWSDAPIGVKFAVVSGGLLVAALAAVTTVSVDAASDSLDEAVEAEMHGIVDTLLGTCRVQRDLLAAKLESDLAVAEQLFVRAAGAPIEGDVCAALSEDPDDPRTIGPHTLPALRGGDHLFTGDVAFVDEVLARTGSTCTVFHVTPQRWVRVATNVKKPDGSRAVGTTIEPASPVFKHVMGGEIFIGVNKIQGKTFDTAYRPIRDASGRIVAVLYVGVPHAGFTALREAIAGVEILETGYAYCVNSDGVFTVHPTDEGRDVSDLEFVREMTDRLEGTTYYTWEGAEKVVVYDYFEPYDWIVSASATLEEARAPAAALQARLLIGAAVAAAVACALVFIAGRVVAQSVDRVRRAIEDIAQGEGDLTRRLDVSSRDETGKLAAAFNLFVEKIHRVIVEVASASEDVSAAATQVSASGEQMAAGMHSQREQSARSSEEAGRIAEGADSLASRGRDVAGEANAAGEQAAAGSDVVRRTVEGIRELERIVSQSSRSVDGLGQRAEQIEDIINVINDIADQTNLLALNAAIEAARAGEHGRGFAVVADEVRKLADRTTKATEEVAEAVRGIQEGTGEAVREMSRGGESVAQQVTLANEAGEALQAILTGANAVRDAIGSIADGSEQQRRSLSELGDSIRRMDEIASEASEGAAQAAAAATELDAKATHLQGVVGQFKVNRT